MTKCLAIICMAIFIICNYGCKSSKASIQKEFEGVITYHEINKTMDGTIDVDDTVKLYYANGNYVALHSTNESKFHVVKDYYFSAPTPLRLFLYNNSDTLSLLKIDSSFGKLEKFAVKKAREQVLSRNCERIEMSFSFNEKDSTTYSDIGFTFSKGYLNVNKAHFKHWELGGFNKVIDKSGSFYLKFKSVHFDHTHKNILSFKSYEVISVEEIHVDPEIFKIDPQKIKKAPSVN